MSTSDILMSYKEMCLLFIDALSICYVGLQMTHI